MKFHENIPLFSFQIWVSSHSFHICDVNLIVSMVKVSWSSRKLQWFYFIFCLFLSLFLVLCFCHLFLFIILFVSWSYCSHSINAESSNAWPWIFVHIITTLAMLLSSLCKLYVLNFHTLLVLLLKGLWWLLQCCFPQFKVSYKVMCFQKKPTFQVVTSSF